MTSCGRNSGCYRGPLRPIAVGVLFLVSWAGALLFIFFLGVSHRRLNGRVWRRLSLCLVALLLSVLSVQIAVSLYLYGKWPTSPWRGAAFASSLGAALAAPEAPRSTIA